MRRTLPSRAPCRVSFHAGTRRRRSSPRRSSGNEDYFGNATRNEDDPLVQQAKDVLGYIADQYRPIRLKSWQVRRTEKGESGIGALESFLGINVAPQKVTRTAVEDYLHSVAPPIHRTKEEGSRAAARRDLVVARQSGDVAAV